MRFSGLISLLCMASLSACQTADSSSDKTLPESTKAPKAGGGVLAAFKPQPVVLPEGTTLHLVLETAVSSATNRQGDPVLARVADDTRVGEKVVLAAGTEIRGQVVAAVPSGRVKGLARLAIDFDRLVVKGKEHPIEAQAIDITADNTHKRDAEIIGGSTAGGLLIGALAGGKKGAGIGALVGAGAGGGVVLTNKGKEVQIPSGSHFGVKLQRDALLS